MYALSRVSLANDDYNLLIERIFYNCVIIILNMISDRAICFGMFSYVTINQIINELNMRMS
jgi:hypothetical protein